MKIDKLSRPWVKNINHRHNERGPREYYQTANWKSLVDQVWSRDKAICQLCLQNGIKHYLERGTQDRTKQGTVDHKIQRVNGGSDTLDNLWLIGSNHHDAKSATEKNAKYAKK